MRREGFSLVEIAIVLVVVSVMISGVLPYVTESQKTSALNETAGRLEAIELAMLTYRAANGFIPCPSDITVALNAGAFGTAVASNCATANFTTAAVAGGGVPTKTLGLADEYAFDGWGRRLTYHVTRNLTASGTYGTTTVGSIEVRDAAGGARTTEAAYAVVSHGPNGHGAYLRAANQRFNFGSNNADEHDNASYNALGAATPAYNNILHQYMATPDDGDAGTNDPDGFDDIVRFQLKPSLELLVGGGGLWEAGTSPNDITNSNSGNVGIGTATPRAKLDVAGDLRIGGTATACTATNAGAIRYTAGAVEFCNGTAWTAMGGGGGGISDTDFQTVSNSVTAIGNKTVSVTCPANYTMTGGGCNSVAWGSELVDNYPNGNGWYCASKDSYGTAQTTIVYARCVLTN